MKQFTDKVALVTGSTDGVGETIADTLHAQGATVVISSRHQDVIDKKVKQLDESGKTAFGIQCDVSDAQSVRNMIEAVMNRFKRLDLAVNNAGMTGDHNRSIPEQTIENWDAVIATSLSGVFYSLKYEIPAMLQSGGGAIVNLSAVNGFVGIAGLAPYTVAKHGVIGLTQTAALEYADKGVRINAVAPGYVDTPKMQELPKDIYNLFAESHPMKRYATRQEIADFVLFLLSDKAGFCTGGVYPIDGGYLAR